MTAAGVACWVGLEREWVDTGLEVGMKMSLEILCKLKFLKSSVEKWHCKQNQKYVI